MSVASVLARGRRAAEARMVDTCRIEHNAGDVIDDIDVVPNWQPVYDGKCRVQTRAAADTTGEQAGQQVIDVLRVELELPIATAGISVNDRVTITTATNDPDLQDRELYVAQLFHKTDATARRLPLKETTS